jgi:riboflavin synthase
MTISESEEILNDCHVGDSISINGACLTVTEYTKDSFKVGLAPETLEKTDLGRESYARSLLHALKWECKVS